MEYMNNIPNETKQKQNIYSRIGNQTNNEIVI